MEDQEYHDILKWDFYGKTVASGYFKEFDENGFENYEDRNLYEWSVESFGLQNAIDVINHNRENQMSFTKDNLQYAYDWEEWRTKKG